MPDHFALLNEPRRPWLDPEDLKQKFLALSAAVHPDRVHCRGEADRATAQQRYVELNGAYHCLRAPKDRLRHLLELEQGAVPGDIERIPSDLMDLSLEVGNACRAADGLVAEKSKVTSPLLRVQLFERGQDLTERLTALARKLGARHGLLMEELKKIDGAWNADAIAGSPGRAALLPRLEALYRLFSYFDRWNGQVQERLAGLSF